MGCAALRGGTITLTPECLQPRMAPPRASTMKLTRNLRRAKQHLLVNLLAAGASSMTQGSPKNKNQIDNNWKKLRKLKKKTMVKVKIVETELKW